MAKNEFGVYKVEHIHINYKEIVERNVAGKKKPKKVKQNFQLTYFYSDTEKGFPQLFPLSVALSPLAHDNCSFSAMQWSDCNPDFLLNTLGKMSFFM